MAATIALGDSSRARSALRLEQAQNARLLKQDFAYRAEQSLHAERARMARELHDALGHHLSVIALHTEVARESLAPLEKEAHQALSHIRLASAESLRELRALVRFLRAPVTSSSAGPVPSLARLPILLDSAAARGLRLAVHTRGTLDRLPAAVDAAAYRIVQEAITNVIRHAGATELSLSLVVDDEALQVRLRDNGPSGERPVMPGGGIRGMQERARLLGGSLSAWRLPAGGFEVSARLPLKEMP
jgi:signal transduction histidine kinase